MLGQALAFLHDDVLFAIGDAGGIALLQAVAHGKEHAADLLKLARAEVGDVPAQHHALDGADCVLVLRPLVHVPIGRARQADVALPEKLLRPCDIAVDNRTLHKSILLS